MFAAPYPRYRIYTRPNSYIALARDFLLGRVRRGDDVRRLEEKLCGMLDVPFAVCVPQARVGIYLAIKTLIQPGQGVVMSPYTIADVVNMVICAGGCPVFADIDQPSCNISPANIAPLIDADTGAVLIAHLHGLAAPSHEILQTCRQHGVALVEDAAQAFGGKERGKYVGTIGDAGIYSFGMYKNINAWFGGAIVSSSESFIDQIRSELQQWEYERTTKILWKAKQGFVTDVATFPPLFRLMTYRVFRYGFLNDVDWINRMVDPELDTSRKKSFPGDFQARLTPFQARLGMSQLARIEPDNQERIRRAELYRAGLAGLDGLILPPEPRDSTDIYTYYPVQYKDLRKLLKYAMRHRRDFAPQHLRNCADLPGFSEFYRDCPESRETAQQVAILPTYPRYPLTEVEKNIQVLRSFFTEEAAGRDRAGG
jgi:dTDP-4-amino-4,6-dideoxygalactose transaminase